MRQDAYFVVEFVSAIAIDKIFITMRDDFMAHARHLSLFLEVTFVLVFYNDDVIAKTIGL